MKQLQTVANERFPGRWVLDGSVAGSAGMDLSDWRLIYETDKLIEAIQNSWLAQNTIVKDTDGRVGVVVEPVNDALETKLRWMDGSTHTSVVYECIMLLSTCRAQSTVRPFQTVYV